MENIYEIVKCRQCGKEVKKLNLFSGGICVDCYEKNFDKLTDEEKKPNFTKTINI